MATAELALVSFLSGCCYFHHFLDCAGGIYNSSDWITTAREEQNGCLANPQAVHGLIDVVHPHHKTPGRGLPIVCDPDPYTHQVPGMSSLGFATENTCRQLSGRANLRGGWLAKEQSPCGATIGGAIKCRVPIQICIEHPTRRG